MNRVRATLVEFGWIMGVSVLTSGVSYWLTPRYRQPPPEAPLQKEVPSRNEDALAGAPGLPLATPSAHSGEKSAGRPPQTLEGRFPQRQGQPVRKIQFADAKTAFRMKAAFLDARRTDSFLTGHIKGAIAIPVWEEGVRGRVSAFKASWGQPATTPVVVYCAGGACEDAELLAAYLVREGLQNILIYEGGFPEWEMHGQPVEVRE